MNLVLPRVGSLTGKVGIAALQYEPANPNLASPAFLNASTGFSTAGGNNCGAFGLRYLYLNVFPFDATPSTENNRKIVQFAGGSISGAGISEVTSLLTDPTEFGDWNGGTGDYLIADDANAIYLDAGSYQQSSNEFLTYRATFPVIGGFPYAASLGASIQNYNAFAGLDLIYQGGFPVNGRVYTRTTQTGGSPPFSAGTYVDTTANTPTALQIPVPGGSPRSAQGLSLLNPSGYATFWNPSTQTFQGINSNALPFSAIDGTLPSLSGPLDLVFADATDNEVIQSGGLTARFQNTLITGGHFMIHLPGSTTYYIILANLSGYYKVVFVPDTDATEVALGQSGLVPQAAYGYGQDVTGNFWFQAPPADNEFPILFSTLTYADALLFTSLMPGGLPFMQFQTTNCRRLFAGYRSIFEG